MNARPIVLALAAFLLSCSVLWSQAVSKAESVKLPEMQPPAAAAPEQSGNPATKPSAPETTGFHERYPRYLIHEADVLDISFTLSPEFNQTVTVQPDGFISLRDAGDVHVAGMTTEEALQAVAKAYSKILRAPVVSLVLKDFEKPYFAAGGELKNPGKYELRGNISVVQGIALAGGFTTSAKHSEVYLFRRSSKEEVKVMKLDVKQMMAQKDLSEDLYLKPGDVLWVPQNTFSKVKSVIQMFSGMVRFPVP